MKIDRKKAISIITIVFMLVFFSFPVNIKTKNKTYYDILYTRFKKKNVLFNYQAFGHEEAENGFSQTLNYLNSTRRYTKIKEYEEAKQKALNICLGLVGMPGTCFEIATLFVYLFYGYDHSIMNMYVVDNPEPGDIIYYADGGVGIEHWGVYIDNSISLQGNFDGQAILCNMYLQGASSPIFYRVV